MKMKKTKAQQNYLDFVPISNIGSYTTDESGTVTFEIENKGVFNKMAQKLFKKPKICYIHLDEMGSFIWPYIDGKCNIYEIGGFVKEHFGEKSEPFYPRLSQFFKTLEGNGFVKFNK